MAEKKRGRRGGERVTRDGMQSTERRRGKRRFAEARAARELRRRGGLPSEASKASLCEGPAPCSEPSPMGTVPRTHPPRTASQKSCTAPRDQR